ncbi:Tetratricopeptide-like helical domain protein [Pleurostoma richardsiae]|uniref:Tetratricopeptide-like helical domain protein n=1 Tax=Pleurostoma richardsiae TaxID=41990 RepID=A0AA38R2L4_9PEZI|nr:Tetratricopeptide-like helical domain protein [Pleurostoma richardsiae]
MPQHIELAMPVDSLDGVYAVGAALLAGAMFIVLLWRLTSKPPTRPRPAKPRCYRVREIPMSTTEGELRDQIATHHLGAADLRLTLARSSPTYCMATLLSSDRPKIEAMGYPVDSDFLGITPLFGGGDAAVDIIAVHGLGSHAIGAFKAKDNNSVWLRDFLPKDIPTARMLVYGYDTTITDKDAKYSIKDLGRAFLDSYKAFREATQTSRRPIVFIGHSLGGLLVKEALSMSLEDTDDPQSRDFFNSSYALVFFGVPNLGLRQGKLKEITAGQLNGQLIHDLELDTESEPTPYLRELKDKFNRCCRKQTPPFRIVSYYEQKKTPTADMRNGKLVREGDACFMVTQESACRIGLEDNEHDRQPLLANHSDMVKYPSAEDDTYRRVGNRLARLVEDAPGVVQGRFSSHIALSPDEKRHWDDLNVPDYRAFRENTEKLAKPADGTLQWLVSDQPHLSSPQWLFPDHPSRSFPSSGSDSLSSADFSTWRDADTPSSLLVMGPPGQGKSVLSNFVVDHLLGLSGERGIGKVIYYFCNIKNDEGSRNASMILRALIVQLCEDARLFRMLPNRFQDRNDRKAFHSAHLDDLWRTLDDLIKSCPYSIYCVIDGLDVYETGMRDLLKHLETLMAYKQHDLKLFCTSRSTGPVDAVSLSPKRIFRPPDEDLRRFVDERLATSPKLRKWEDDVRKAVIRRSGGTFLWISIILRELSSLRYLSKAKIDEAIKKTPIELDDLYGDLVRATFKDSYDVAILLWVAYARKPLTVEALETATAITVNPGIASYADCCSQKVSVDVVKAAAANYWSGREVMELLLEKRGSDVEITAEVVKAAAANSGSGRQVMELLLEKRGNDVEITAEVVIVISRTWPSNVMELLLEKRGSDVEITAEVVEAAAANEWNGREVMELLLEKRGNDVEITTEVVKAAAANYSSGREVMELLLEKRGNDVEITAEVVKAAAANYSSGRQVMELLLEKRGNDITPLLDTSIFVGAAASGQLEVLDLLCRHSFFPLQDGWISIATLYRAARDGDVKTVRKLLGDGVPPDTKNLQSQTPLWVAAYWGHRDVVEVLVPRPDVDMNSRCEAGRPPLFWPSAYGDKDIVALLKEAGADATIADADGETPITQQFDGRQEVQGGLVGLVDQLDQLDLLGLLGLLCLVDPSLLEARGGNGGREGQGDLGDLVIQEALQDLGVLGIHGVLARQEDHDNIHRASEV